MPSLPCLLLLVLGLCLAALPPAQAAGRTALVIGNNAYQSAPLLNPVNDARAMAATLEATGFSVMLRTDIDQRAMLAAVREFGDRLKSAGGVGVFYFAGHGMQIKGRNFLIPVGSQIEREDEVAYQAIEAQAVLDKMESAGNGTNLMILDACRDNPFMRSFRSASPGLAPMDAPVGTLVAFATAPGLKAADGTGSNGLYTSHLLAAMRQPGTKVEDVFKQVRGAVRRESQGKQVPMEWSSLEGDFYFVPGAAGAAQPVDTQATVDDALWSVVKDSSSSAEVFAYLNRFPSGRHARQARARLADFSAPRPPDPGPATTGPQRPGERNGPVFKDCDECPEMVVIPAGTYIMGSPAIEMGRYGDEGPLHAVQVASFAAGRFELTFAQWDACVVAGGCQRLDDQDWGRGQNPAINASWNDAQDYVKWIAGKTGKPYRLLSETEWEYAARAGSSAEYPWGSALGQGNANCSDCGSRWHRKPAPVGQFPANAFGLHDMNGNAWEWVQDVWHDRYMGAPEDGSPWVSGGNQMLRVLRGGSWDFSSQFMRSAYRTRNAPQYRDVDTGFRLARNLP